MESKTISDMKIISNKNTKLYMPHKQIGFFEERNLNKNISSLKESLKKKVEFINIYNSPLIKNPSKHPILTKENLLKNSNDSEIENNNGKFTDNLTKFEDIKRTVEDHIDMNNRYMNNDISQNKDLDDIDNNSKSTNGINYKNDNNSNSFYFKNLNLKKRSNTEKELNKINLLSQDDNTNMDNNRDTSDEKDIYIKMSSTNFKNFPCFKNNNNLDKNKKKGNLNLRKFHNNKNNIIINNNNINNDVYLNTTKNKSTKIILNSINNNNNIDNNIKETDNINEDKSKNLLREAFSANSIHEINPIGINGELFTNHSKKSNHKNNNKDNMSAANILKNKFISNKINKEKDVDNNNNKNIKNIKKKTSNNNVTNKYNNTNTNEINLNNAANNNTNNEENNLNNANNNNNSNNNMEENNNYNNSSHNSSFKNTFSSNFNNFDSSKSKNTTNNNINSSNINNTNSNILINVNSNINNMSLVNLNNNNNNNNINSSNVVSNRKILNNKSIKKIQNNNNDKNDNYNYTKTVSSNGINISFNNNINNLNSSKNKKTINEGNNTKNNSFNNNNNNINNKNYLNIINNKSNPNSINNSSTKKIEGNKILPDNKINNITSNNNNINKNESNINNINNQEINDNNEYNNNNNENNSIVINDINTTVYSKGELNESNIYNRGKNNSNLNTINNIDTYNCSDNNNNLYKFQKDKVNSKIDFIYKKIFDKRSRNLIEVKQKEILNESIKKNSNKGGKKTQYIEEKINDIKRKIFFIKGVYDFSYPKIVVNNVKCSQVFFNENFKEEKLKLRESMNNISSKVLEKNLDKLAKTMQKFRPAFNIEKNKGESFINSGRHFIWNDINSCNDSEIDIKNSNQNKNNNNIDNNNVNNYDNENENDDDNKFPEIKRMIKTTGNFNFNSLKKMRRTLTEKFMSPEKIQKFSIVNPIEIKSFYPDLGVPVKNKKILHKEKLYGSGFY
jgi:hypothetical protein